MPFLPNSNIKIYKTSDTINSVWEGTTDSNGRTTNMYGPPSLRYGDYIAVSEHCDYDKETTTPFTIPGTNVIPMSIGCTSSITTHETVYDHSKLTSGLTLPPGIGPLPYSGTTPPSGWLLCDGSAISRTIYSSLFTVIGTIYGIGDGSTTFNIPDMRGRVPAGIGASGIVNLGNIGGEQNHTLTIAEMPSHTHSGYGLGNSQIGIGTGNPPMVYSTGSAGGGQTHNNMQPYLGVNYIISI